MKPVSTTSTTISGLRPIPLLPCSLFLGSRGLFGIRTTAGQADYIVVASDGDIELRDYTACVTAETLVDTGFREAENRALRKLFAYSSGDNRTRRDIAVTAPVIASDEVMIDVGAR